MGTNILRNIKRAGLALLLVAASAFGMADTQAGRVFEWTYGSGVSGTRNAVACGRAGNEFNEYDVVLLKDGTVLVNNQPAGLTGITAIAPGHRTCLALRSDGTVTCAGYPGTPSITLPSGLHDVASVAAGYETYYAVQLDGKVVGWNPNGSLISGLPAADPVNPVVKVTSAAGGGTLFLHKDGTVTAQGDWYDFSFNLVPIQIPAGLSDVTDIAMTYRFGMALKSDHTVVCFGPDAAASQAKFQETDYESIACGYDFAMAVRSNDYDGRHLATYIPSDSLAVGYRVGDMPPGPTPISLGGGANTYGFIGILQDFDGKVTLNGNTLVGASTQRVTATVTLDNIAAEDRYLSFASDSLFVLEPVKVAKGKRTATFSVYATNVAEQVNDSLYLEGSWIDWVRVLPITVNSLKLDPASVVGGLTTTGTVTLSQAPLYSYGVGVVSDNSKVNPGFGAVIPAGSRTGTFTIRTSPVTETTPVKLKAYNDEFGYAFTSATLTLQPRPVVKSVTLASSMYGHQTITGTVNLALAAGSTGATVTISGDGLTTPSTITIPAGSKTGTFTVTADDPSAATLHHLMFSTATSAMGKDVTIRPNLLASVTLAATSAQAGTSTTGTVTLAQPVAVDTVVALSSAKPTVASVPATVTIPAGSSSASFSITTYVKTQGNVAITATKNTSVKRATLVVTK